MTAPVPTVRVVPDGLKLEDGFPTKMTFSLDPNINVWEKMVTPPGYDAGEKINITTMWNTTFRTYACRQLIDVTDMNLAGAYDPNVYPQIQAVLGKAQTITITFPNRDTLCFYGVLKDFKPGSLEEGKFPDCQLTVYATNVDPVTGDEESPVYTEFVAP